MKQKKLDNKLVYIGDVDFLKELKARPKGAETKTDHFLYVFRKYDPGIFLEVAQQELPNVIIFEVPKKNKTLIHEELYFLKSIPHFKPIMLIAIFPDKEVLFENMTLLGCGVSFCYIAGCEYEHLFRDCLLYGFEQKISTPSFAKAKELTIRKNIKVISSIECLFEDKIILNTDVNVSSQESLKVCLYLLNDQKVRSFEIHSHKSSDSALSTDKYELRLPFSGPWEEPSNETIHKDCILDFLEAYSTDFDIKSGYIWNFLSPKHSKEIFLSGSEFPFIIEYKNLLKAEGYAEEIEVKMPSILFIEFKDSQDEEEFTCFMTLMNSILNVQGYTPFLILMNTEKSSQQLQTITGYKNIIGTNNKMDSNFYAEILNKFLNKHPSKDGDLKTFKKDDINRVAHIEFEARILSLTEHELEFELNFELSLFSLLSIDLPEKNLITIIQSKKVEDNWVYTGVLNGMDDLAYQHIRKIINQLIYNPQNELSTEDMNKILYNPVVKSQPIQQKLENLEKEAVISSKELDRVFVRPHKSKSKL